MAHLCVPQHQALGVCRGFVRDIQVCGTHGREDLVNATTTSKAEEEDELVSLIITAGLKSLSAWNKQLFVMIMGCGVMGLTHGQFVCLLVGCLTSQQQASVSQGRICTDNFTCCHTEIEVADPTFYLTQSQYTDTGLTSPSADPITPGAWQGSHWSANF